MGMRFQVKPVKKYKAGYPKKGFFRRSFVCTVPLKLFSFFIVGLLFFITVPGCDEKEELSGVTVPDHDTELTDTETGDETVTDDALPDKEFNDFDEVDGLAPPECMVDEDCEEGFVCDTSSYTCVEEMLGDPMPECMTDEDCEEGFLCDTSTYTCIEELAGEPVAECYKDDDCEEGFICDVSNNTCVEEMLGDPVPDHEINDDLSDTEEIPDEELGGIAPPELK